MTVKGFKLTSRQFDVYRELCLGQTDTMVALKYKISPRTVQTVVARMIAVTQSKNRTEMVYKITYYGYEIKSTRNNFTKWNRKVTE